MDAKEVAYVGGLFEGEGSFTFVRSSIYKAKRYLSCVARIQMTDKEPLERAMAATGLGYIHGPHSDKRGPNRKNTWTWQVNGWEQVQALVAMLWFYLGPRRRARAAEVLTDVLAGKRALGQPNKSHISRRPRRSE